MLVPDTPIGRLKAWLRGWPRAEVSALVEGRDEAGNFFLNVAAHALDMSALEEACAALLSETGAELVEVAEARAGRQRIPPDRAIVATTGRAYFAVDVPTSKGADERV
ncbi:MAG: hypothetical protein AAF618_11155 [Pseudomonadota bacterium]